MRADRLARAGAALALLLLARLAGEAAAHGPPAASAGGPVFDFVPPEPGTYRLPPIKAAADGPVLDSDGSRHGLAALMRGKVTVLSFVYTRCSDPFGCPLATGALFDLFDASAADPALARDLQLLSLSFDPAHDDPARMAEYGASALAQAGPGRASWRFLTAESEAAVEPMLAAYGQAVDRRLEHGEESTINHLLRVYLVDPELRVRNIYGVDYLDPRLVLADVRTLLLEKASRAASP
jgi:cytochrome oxidase Cu insertion factor (SCO1/SenC/PrrC family)